MNKINKILAVLLIVAGIVFLNSCIKGDVDQPPTPTAGLTANTTIAQLTKFFADSMGSGFGTITKDIIVQGIVVANDAGGNIYKAIYLVDNTGGLDVALDQSYLYNTYTLGQRIYIKCKGLSLGNNSGVMELGYNNGGAIGRIPSNFIKNYLFLDGFPKGSPVPTTIAIPSVSSYSLTNPILCTLVKFDSVHFYSADVGQPFSSLTTSTSRTIQDNHWGSIMLYNSNYAEFASTLVPSGTGSVTGILVYYAGKSQWELFIRNLNDLQGFQWK